MTAKEMARYAIIARLRRETTAESLALQLQASRGQIVPIVEELVKKGAVLRKEGGYFIRNDNIPEIELRRAEIVNALYFEALEISVLKERVQMSDDVFPVILADMGTDDMVILEAGNVIDLIRGVQIPGATEQIVDPTF